MATIVTQMRQTRSASSTVSHDDWPHYSRDISRQYQGRCDNARAAFPANPYYPAESSEVASFGHGPLQARKRHTAHCSADLDGSAAPAGFECVLALKEGNAPAVGVRLLARMPVVISSTSRPLSRYQVRIPSGADVPRRARNRLGRRITGQPSPAHPRILLRTPGSWQPSICTPAKAPGRPSPDRPPCSFTASSPVVPAATRLALLLLSPAPGARADCLRLPPAHSPARPGLPCSLTSPSPRRGRRSSRARCAVGLRGLNAERLFLTYSSRDVALAELRSSRELLAAFAQPTNGAVAAARRGHGQLYLARSAPLLLAVLPFALADAVVCRRPSGFAEGLQTEQPHENAHDPV
ncbi:hypothetical protein K491DRAFT_675663 [Lophiostoma macrostomum CBS 122681]|uniref:Uncharacterized protein n=1 Tax=Lophiostoma macrostomum CBS 122681 TaxID=1314788 RepID=A0A6A6TJ45_9PLEO|nr:hypothetical protein K491DRAFT_675663 [Lophiostoma macrostomum CBS 122681]